MKWNVIILIFFVFHNSFTYDITYIRSLTVQKMIPISISIPKCGTHMMCQLLRRMLARDSSDIPHNYDATTYLNLSHYHADRVYFGHVWPTFAAVNFFSKPPFKGFIVIRDPRAMALSFVNYVQQGNGIGFPSCLTPFDQLFKAIIINPGFRYGGDFYTTRSDATLEDRYRIFLLWAKLGNFCLIRFEDLVGPKGGGTRQAQIYTVKKIANHLGLMLSDTQCILLAEEVFGGSDTFHRGQIDRWRNELTYDQKVLFKKYFSTDYLIQLGYETSYDW